RSFADFNAQVKNSTEYLTLVVQQKNPRRRAHIMQNFTSLLNRLKPFAIQQRVSLVQYFFKSVGFRTTRSQTLDKATGQVHYIHVVIESCLQELYINDILFRINGTKVFPLFSWETLIRPNTNVTFEFIASSQLRKQSQEWTLHSSTSSTASTST